MAVLKDLIVNGVSRFIGKIHVDDSRIETINGSTVGDNPKFTDTLNTSGSSNTSSKIFLIGATSQADNPQTYSHDTAYVGTDGHLYSDSKQVVNLSGTQALTNKTYNGYTLAAASAKGVDTSISDGSTSTNLPTTAAVASYVSSAISEGAITSAGAGLTKDGSALKHTNSVSAQTTQAVYPIKIDGQGHISAYGSAQTILALGTSSSTAYRGDYGNTAYTHATDANRLTTAKSEALYKIATTTHGHIKSATAVEKADITALGIPAADTHHTAYIRAGASGGTANAATTTGNTYLNLVENGENRSGVKLVPGTNMTITSDASGNVTIATTASDTKVTNTLATTTKTYVTGTATATTNTGTQNFDTGVYLTTTAGQLNATTYKVNEQVTMQWNNTTESLDFVFS